MSPRTTDNPSPASAGEAHPPVQNDLPPNSGPVSSYDDVLIDSIELRHRDPDALRPLLATIKKGWASEDGRILGCDDINGAKLTRNSLTGKSKFVAMGKAMARRRYHTDDFDLVSQAVAVGATSLYLHLARDFSEGPSVPFLLHAHSQGLVLPKNSVHTYDSENPATATVYVGSPNGLVELRAYNRATKLAKIGHTPPVATLWRYELTIRRYAATQALRMLAAIPPKADDQTGEVIWPIHAFFNGILADHMRVVTGPVGRAHRNQGRAKLDPVWAAFVAVQDPTISSGLARVITPTQDLENRFKALRGLAHAYADAIDLGGADFAETLLRLGINKGNRHALVDGDRKEALRILREVFGNGSDGAEGGHPV